MEHTPHFVRWTLARACPLREETDVADPDQTERQLRVLRTYADAAHAGRCYEGLCVDEAIEHGFFAEEVLAAYGGEPFVLAQCANCPANTLAARETGNVAGCFGWLVLNEEVIARLEKSLGSVETGTMPRWYGLWMENAPSRALLALQAAVWDWPSNDSQIVDFRAAIKIALADNVRLYWSLSPRGKSDGLSWTIAAHCPRCKASITRREQRCAVCGFVGACAPERTRKARGRRPYQPLARILGAERAEAFVRRYRARGEEVE